LDAVADEIQYDHEYEEEPAPVVKQPVQPVRKAPVKAAVVEDDDEMF
jgi:hypothetical protein